MARLDFIVNVRSTGTFSVALAAGDLEPAHADWSNSSAATRASAAERPLDVIVTGPGSPLDINLYQGTKTLVGLQPMIEGMAAGGPRRCAV